MKKFSTALIVSVLAIFLVAGNVWATAILKLSSGTDEVTIVDDDGDGVVSYGGSIGDFSVNVSTGITKPTIGATNFPELDLASVNVSGGSGTIDIWFTETGFTLPDTIPGFRSEVGGTTAGTVELKTYLDDNNTAFGTGTLLSDLGPFNASPFSGSDNVNINPSDPFSLTMESTVTHTGGSQISSFDGKLSPVPEPATILLMGLGLLGLGIVGRKKLANKPS